VISAFGLADFSLPAFQHVSFSAFVLSFQPLAFPSWPLYDTRMYEPPQTAPQEQEVLPLCQ
jgi:hypothetical protein